jgi:prevent-host-death family protein
MGANYSIDEVKMKFSKILRKIKNGEVIIVTECGKPVAKVVPYTEFFSRLERLREKGHIEPLKMNRKFPLSETRKGALARFLKFR